MARLQEKGLAIIEGQLAGPEPPAKSARFTCATRIRT
jgi:hypothetical protein